MRSTARRASLRPSVSPNACTITRPNCPAASSSASRWRAPLAPIRRSWSPTSRPAISTRRPDGRSSNCCSPATPSAARRWCSSRTMRRWRGAATASCGCVRAGSSALNRTPRELGSGHADSRFAGFFHDASRNPPARPPQARLYGVHGGADPGLLALLRTDELSLFLRRLSDHHADRRMARKPAARLDVRGRHPAAAGLLVHRFHRPCVRPLADRDDELHVQSEFVVVSPRPLAVPRLDSISARLLGLEARLRQTRLAGLDRARVGADFGLFRLHAAAAGRSRPDAGQHQLRVGHERRRGADVGASLCLGRRIDDLDAADRVYPHASHADALFSEGAMTDATTAPTSGILLAPRFALRALCGGLRGFAVFIACIAVGVAAIAGVSSFARSLGDGLAREGRVILGGDVSFSLIHREVSAQERAFLESYGRVSVAATMRAMAGTSSGERALVELKAVDEAYPLFGAVGLEPAGDLRAALAERDGVFGAAVDPALLARLNLGLGDQVTDGTAKIELRAVLKNEPDKLAGGLAFGPRLLISEAALRGTGLLQPGSLVRWHYRVMLSRSTGVENGAAAVVAASAAQFADAGWEVRTRTNASPALGRNIERFTQYLTLVGLTALLIGAVGVANAVKHHLDRRREVIATLKSLGATGGRVFAVYFCAGMLLAAAA